ncbi:MAG TPA: RNA polymerase subunit sigma-24 [Bacteroidia bacterium]|nr:RNA polymerase subunit sigma-24 [Bacteroidia bacterium]
MSLPSDKDTFQTTSWSVVRRALSEDRPDSLAALSSLCETYWYPIYAFIRRSGHRPHDAEDLTQGFFALLIEKRFLAVADEDKGRLRTFLLTCVGRYLSNEAERPRRLKRGAGKVLSIDPRQAEEYFAAEACDDLSPDRLYQRRWALILLEATTRAIGEQYAAEGKSGLFAAISPFLGFSRSGEEGYREVAGRLGMNPATLRSHVHRLRERWRELLMRQVAATLDDPTSDNIKAELAELIGCV